MGMIEMSHIVNVVCVCLEETHITGYITPSDPDLDRVPRCQIIHCN